MNKKIMQDFLKHGRLYEREVATYMTNVKQSDPYADMNYHIDLDGYLDDKYETVDAKGLKKISRNDSNYNDNFHWVELTNVNKKTGWLYGKATLFAFFTKKEIIFLKKTILQEFIEGKVNQKVLVDNPYDALYKTYSRESRGDLITLIPTDDLKSIAYKVETRTEENLRIFEEESKKLEEEKIIEGKRQEYFLKQFFENKKINERV